MGKQARMVNRMKRRREQIQLAAISRAAELTLIMADRLELMTSEQRQELVDRHLLKAEYLDEPELFRQHFFGDFVPEHRLIAVDEATIENWIADVVDFEDLLEIAQISPNVTFSPPTRVAE